MSTDASSSFDSLDPSTGGFVPSSTEPSSTPVLPPDFLSGAANLSAADTAQSESIWSYDRAFCRNLGLINPEEQKKLRESTVAIPGMGGVGGFHLMTLVRTGIGRFHIADQDTFDVANFNRQRGASIHTVGRNKAAVMAEAALAVNPQLKLKTWNKPVDAGNVGDFLDGATVLLDSLDFFSFETRRVMYREAQARKIWVVTAGPIGLSTAWLVFDPEGMSYDDYFDMHDGMEPVDLFAAFLVGLTPRGTQVPYMDMSYVDAGTARGRSTGLACTLCAGVAAAEIVKILLNRGPLSPAPAYTQFDAYRRILRTGKLRWGNRGPLQRIKRALMRRQMLNMGYGREDS